MTKEWKPGINHIEFWVSDYKISLPFYNKLFTIIGWSQLNEFSYSTGTMEIYFKEMHEVRRKTIGPRHICFQAINKGVVDEVYNFLVETNTEVIRGPILRNEYSEGYYTVDFFDPDGYILEVAYTPSMVL